MKVGSYKFDQWCIDNDKNWLIDNWCYELNKCDPCDISYSSNKKMWFHCGNPKHKPQRLSITYLTSGRCGTNKDNYCIGCKSVGAYIVDYYNDDYLAKIWSDKNLVSPYDISAGSSKDIWLKCLCGLDHPDYKLKAYNVKNSIKCPYCSGKQVCKTNSVGFLFPEIVELWSEKNNSTAFDYTPNSNRQVFLKCPVGKHKDYKRKLCAHLMYNFRCPECSKENQVILSGPDSPLWNPNYPEDRRFRKTREYNDWRISVFEHDKYICQCCLDRKNNRLNAHHIYSFSVYKEIRLSPQNGITLCECCHDSNIKGSFHNIYGTHNTTPIDLETYINDKRKQLGINEIFSIQKYIDSKGEPT